MPFGRPDEQTTGRYIDPGNGTGKTGQGYMWLIGSPGGDVYFHWDLTRKHAVAETVLRGYEEGALQSDGYGAYPAYAAGRDGVLELGCWAHARRPFKEALDGGDKRAAFPLLLINRLYHWERGWDGVGLKGKNLRAALRCSHFGLTLPLLKRVAGHLKEKALPASKLGEACRYLLNQWARLEAVCEDGRLRMDNNLLENAVRPFALGRKNWMFIGRPEAGERAAILYTVIGSCARRGIDPLEYLRDVLTRLPAMTNQDGLRPLLPAHWEPAPGPLQAAATVDADAAAGTRAAAA